jgi:hypothetical protein
MSIRLKWINYKPGIIGGTMQRLFQDCSTKPLPRFLKDYPEALRPLAKVLYQKQPFFFVPARSAYRATLQQAEDNRVLVAFSGGKDSTAAAIRLLQQGFAPELLYVKGINRSYPQEHEKAREIAEILHVPIHVLALQQEGKSDYPDNPLKNQFILGIMVEMGVRAGITKFVQGNLTADTLELSHIDYNYSDAIEMYKAADIYFKSVYPAYQYIYGLLTYESQSFKTVAEYNPAIFNSICSCVMPARYKVSLRRRNELKYGIELLPGRCGSCYKCATEYLHFVLLGLDERNQPFVTHCITVLENNFKTFQHGEKAATTIDVLQLFINKSVLDANLLLC